VFALVLDLNSLLHGARCRFAAVISAPRVAGPGRVEWLEDATAVLSATDFSRSFAAIREYLIAVVRYRKSGLSIPRSHRC
jgi:hypothetical protein